MERDSKWQPARRPQEGLRIRFSLEKKTVIVQGEARTSMVMPIRNLAQDVFGGPSDHSRMKVLRCAIVTVVCASEGSEKGHEGWLLVKIKAWIGKQFQVFQVRLEGQWLGELFLYVSIKTRYCPTPDDKVRPEVLFCVLVTERWVKTSYNDFGPGKGFSA